MQPAGAVTVRVVGVQPFDAIAHSTGLDRVRTQLSFTYQLSYRIVDTCARDELTRTCIASHCIANTSKPGFNAGVSGRVRRRKRGANTRPSEPHACGRHD